MAFFYPEDGGSVMDRNVRNLAACRTPRLMRLQVFLRRVGSTHPRGLPLSEGAWSYFRTATFSSAKYLLAVAAVLNPWPGFEVHSYVDENVVGMLSKAFAVCFV
jgi:hypothetical protein